ncbi:tRNA 2-selenouridine synthase [Planctomycetes bacterium Pla163]|uniref:tRNA 2-selenouridine synthase n=1 Tax=Rohdeia mirabilis TaxID=2528008 RepID=A0A518CUP9_9BACT|nr:tRNA 2-selenouridine synthase [Planctomycetes bacterium Pla163]
MVPERCYPGRSVTDQPLRPPDLGLALPSFSLTAPTPPAGVPIVDLRSPSEYALDHLPGAINVPLFDDDERAVVGTLYRQRGPDEAFERGIEIVVAKVRELVDAVGSAIGHAAVRDGLEERVRRIAAGGTEGLGGRLETSELDELPADAVLLHCWRGGMRSRSVAALLRELGWPVVLLEGGYREYRRLVHARVGELEFPAAFVLRGMTGVGKTLVLNALERRLPGSTVDLEGLADHRSSILGMVGREPRSQKTFETGLCLRVADGFPTGWVAFEGESRKVGDIVLPDAVWKALTGGTSITLTTSTERRVQVLCDDYLATPGSRAELLQQLPFIEGRLGERWKGELCRLLETGREHELVEILLERYYDQRYGHSEKRHPVAHTVDSTDPEACAAEIAAWIAARG